MQADSEIARPARPSQGFGKELFLYTLTDQDFERIRQLIYGIAGISLSPGKRDLVYSRLARRLRVKQIASFAQYVQLLENGDTAEREEFVNALTTNLTSFFREAHHFPILSQHLGRRAGNRPISIWTCAASTGEEPYSIAITAVEHFGGFHAPVRILATDIDTNVLERARLGVYPLEQLKSLSQERLKRFFLRGEGKQAGFAKVRPELQKLIAFRRINLLDREWPVGERFDAVFCRNVMIYFDKQTQYAILAKMAQRLHPDGLFFAGHSESFHQAVDLFRLCGKTVYTPSN
jgi:chemotaxis protein methyltransferase CheR